jgi:uncharacterized protein YbjT (DUF2867 family)
MTKVGITGSSGHLGGLVAARLAALGQPQRLLVRDPSRAPALPGAEVAVAAYGDASAVRRALDGLETVLMVSAGESADRPAQHRSFIAAAANAGVRHLVYTSFVGAGRSAIFTLGRDHGDAELAIRETPVEYTFLRDNFYADLLPMFADAEGLIRGPAGEGRVAAVARADVADSAVAVLRDPAAHRHAAYSLTGPEAVTLAELAARASVAFGRPFTFVNETREEAYASRAGFGAEPWQLDAWVSTYEAIAAGEVQQVTDDVPQLTGHPARRLEDAWAG